MKKQRFRSIETGKIITMWPSTEHSQSSYGLPVWIDKDNYCYGQCDLWPVPFGFTPVFTPHRVRISKHDFRFIPSGYGHYKVTYTSPVTGKSWTAITSDMPLIDDTKNSDEPKAKDLKYLKRLCKLSR